MGAGGAGGAGPTGPASGGDASAQAGASGSAASAPAPDLAESLRQVGAAGKSSFEAAGDAAKAFRSLFFADVSLARSALGRTIAFAGLAIACGASAWLLLMATLIAFLRGAFGWAWTTSMLAGAALSILVAALACWAAMRYFEHTRLKATRRQLARLGIGELADLTPTPDSPQSAREATENLRERDAAGHPMTDKRGVPVTPP
ncbi:MAG: phage holin family protein [Pseudomonadota bacterium]